jgi:NADPH2:quinone reductase
VEAAAGGVGTLLVQLAKSAGAIVVAAAGGERKLTVAREAGADETVDYRAPDWIASVGEVDVVFDGVGGEIGRSAFRLLRPGGRMISYGLASGEWAGIEQQEAEDRQVRLLRPTAPPEALRALAERAQAAAADGRLRPVIGQRFPLDQASAAHAAIESRRTIGKTLLEVR